MQRASDQLRASRCETQDSSVPCQKHSRAYCIIDHHSTAGLIILILKNLRGELGEGSCPAQGTAHVHRAYQPRCLDSWHVPGVNVH